MTEKREIVSGGAVLAAEAAGTGAPVVFLHAAVCDRRMWRAELDAIGRNNRAIAYDRRGFGETRAAREDHSAVADLSAVVETMANGAPSILVGCSQGGRIALDAALLRPSLVKALVLVAPSVAGAPEPAYPPEVRSLIARQSEAERAGDLDRVAAIKAHLWLDGPLQREGRVAGDARRLFLDMNAIALRVPPTGSNLDSVPAYDRLGDIAVPTLVIQGEFDFPHIQERSRHIASAIPAGTFHLLTGTAHVPSLDQPAAVTALISAFVERCARGP